LRFARATATSRCIIVAAAFVPWPEEIVMRAEIERLVEEIKQSVGLLRRHL
jgi:hypothetical protein